MASIPAIIFDSISSDAKVLSAACTRPSSLIASILLNMLDESPTIFWTLLTTLSELSTSTSWVTAASMSTVPSPFLICANASRICGGTRPSISTRVEIIPTDARWPNGFIASTMLPFSTFSQNAPSSCSSDPPPSPASSKVSSASSSLTRALSGGARSCLRAPRPWFTLPSMSFTLAVSEMQSLTKPTINCTRGSHPPTPSFILASAPDLASSACWVVKKRPTSFSIVCSIMSICFESPPSKSLFCTLELNA
mmetsp:Transcript_6648/g.16911  ORF Transcript_6648/g.16911 Transcript_6648/m.16911 type:complete len:252 (-) Transcript_6648:1109-1864(-)